jgi:hypothetical protein
LFGWLTNQKFFKELTDINTVINLKEINEEKIFRDLVPFGFIETGHDSHEEQPMMAVSDDRWLL